MVGPKNLDFWPRLNTLEGKKKMGIIFENKGVPKLKLENNFLT